MTLETILADPASAQLRRLDRVPVRLLAEALRSPELTPAQCQAYQAEFDATDDWHARLALCQTLSTYSTAVCRGLRLATAVVGPVAALRGEQPLPIEPVAQPPVMVVEAAAEPTTEAPGLRINREQVPMWSDGVCSLDELPAGLAWSGEQAPPPVGAQVLVQRGSWRRPQRGQVGAYFHAEGHLGILVTRPGQPAPAALRNERTNAYFGREIRLVA